MAEREHEQFRQALEYQRSARCRKVLLVGIVLSWICFVVSLLILTCGVNTNKSVMIPIICGSGVVAGVSTVYCLCSCLKEERQ